MRKVKFYLGTGFAGASHEDIIEFEDGTTDEEITEYFEEWKNNFLDASWWDVDEGRGMGNDLISRSALIDELKQSGIIADNDYGNAIVDFINSRPIAYDVDKVVERLKEKSEYYIKYGYTDGNLYVSYDDTIEIIKAEMKG